ETRNWLGYMGATVSHYLIFRWFGLAAFLFPPLLFFVGFRLAFKKSLVSLWRYSIFTLFFILWLGLLMGYVVHIADNYHFLGFLSGGFGYELALLSDDFLGWGTFILIFGSLLIFVIFFFNIDQLNWFSFSPKTDTLDESQVEVPSYSSHIGREEKMKGRYDGMEEEADDIALDESEWKLKPEPIKPKSATVEPAFNIEDSALLADEEDELSAEIRDQKFS